MCQIQCMRRPTENNEEIKHGCVFFLHHKVAYNESHWRELNVEELTPKCPCKKGTSRGLCLSEVLQAGIGGRRKQGIHRAPA